MIYTIQNEHIKLDIDSFGAEALHLVCDGVKVLRDRDDVWGRTAPILWPIVGRLKDKYTIINGQKYSMDTHGFLRDHDFEVVEKEENKIVFKDRFSEDTLSQFPFKYEAFVTYELNGKNATTKIVIKNVDNVSYQYNVGGHPGLVCPMYDGEKFEDYKIIFNKKETFGSPSFNFESGGTLNFDEPLLKFENIDHIDLDYKYFEIDAIVIKDIKSDKVCLKNKDGKGIAFTWNGFNTLAFWTRPGSKYLCFEPWRGYADTYKSNHEFSTKPDLVTINPGKVKEVSYNIEVLD